MTTRVGEKDCYTCRSSIYEDKKREGRICIMIKSQDKAAILLEFKYGKAGNAVIVVSDFLVRPETPTKLQTSKDSYD